jgi:hypothetical protein
MERMEKNGKNGKEWKEWKEWEQYTQYTVERRNYRNNESRARSTSEHSTTILATSGFVPACCAKSGKQSDEPCKK